MKIKYLKDHNGFKAGDTNDHENEAANYLIRVGVAEESKEDTMTIEEPDYVEKAEKKPKKEKKETKGLPTAKSKKK